MSKQLETHIGGIRLKNPLIAAPAEHLIESDGVRKALAAGVGAVILKSTNEVDAARAQLRGAEFAALDEFWRPVPWNADAPASVTLATRSGLSPKPFDAWLDDAVSLDREAKLVDSYAVPSLILSDLDHAIARARQIEAAGLRVLEFNIGTPYAREAKGAVATELDPARISMIIGRMRENISLPLWVKISGQSEKVPELARAAFDAGADSVVMAGRLLGLIPDPETMRPMLSTSLGVGGFWNLPLTCHWLALSHLALGPGRPLIGINGAKDGMDIARMMLAGASAVGIASPVMLRGFGVLSEALAEFEAYLLRKNLNASDLVGVAARHRMSFPEMPDLGDNWRNYVPAN